MKYMIMTFGEAAEMFETKSKDWIEEMFEFMHTLNEDLLASGELVETRGLADGRHAKTVRVVDGLSVATDGPFAEAKESLVGYWVVDVESEARAVEIATRIVEHDKEAYPESGIEVRRVLDSAPEV